MNNLVNEKSSYLKEASNQPVNWHPWSEEAFKKAKKEDKPVLLDIGAVWCHWCHVIDKESYEDKETIALINEKFIAVRIDRDERPDLDKRYQSAVSLLNGQSGWPLTVFLTYDKKPFYGGTYFPKTPRFGLPAFKDVLNEVYNLYKKEKKGISETSKNLIESLEKEQETKSRELNYTIIENTINKIISLHDEENGGFGFKPKFPNPEALLFLMQICSKTNRKDIVAIIEKTLNKMAGGGFYDQIGGGFHRYSTDESWRIPHFEKLLNDNALLINVYANAYRITNNEFYKEICREIMDFVIREMFNEAFYSSIDADYKGEEGFYYTWEESELRRIITLSRYKVFSEYYEISKRGNLDGKNVLYLKNDLKTASQKLNMNPKDVLKTIQESKELLLKAREKIEKPGIDKKIITSWNCLMISAFINGYSILQDKKYLDAAVKALEFLLKKLYIKGTVYRVYSDAGKVNGFLEDYAFFVSALLDAFNITNEYRHLEKAVEINEIMIKNFWDNGFLDVEKGRETLIKDKPYLDFLMPSGNSIACVNLLKLYHLTENKSYLSKAEEILKLFCSNNLDNYMNTGSLMTALDLYINSIPVIIITSNNEEFINIINKKIINKILIVKDKFRKELEILKEKESKDNKATVYICYKNTCSIPLINIKDLEKSLERVG